MAFGISVYRSADEEFVTKPPPTVNSQEFDQWAAECHRRRLYESPLGSDGFIYEYWSSIATKLGLTMIASLYNEGLRVGGPDLDVLSRELDVLDDHWDRLDLENAPPVGCTIVNENGTIEVTEVSLRGHVKERMAYLRQAIEIAHRNEGIVLIS